MAYSEQNTVNSHRHVIDLVETFLTAQGWTIEASVDSTERELYVSKANGGETFYFSLKTTGTNSIVINADTAYPSASPSSNTYLNLKSTSMVRCWLFAGELYCYIVVEVAAGYFQMGLFGRLVPYGTFSSGNQEGAFAFGNNNTAWSTLDNIAGSSYFSLFYSGSGTGTRVRHVPVAGAEWGDEHPPIQGYYASSPYPYRESFLVSRLPNANGERPMLPIRVSLPNNPAVESGYMNYYPLGYLPEVCVLNFNNVVNASEETIGADTWKRFPPPHQNVAVTDIYYADTEIGLAFKK